VSATLRARGDILDRSELVGPIDDTVEAITSDPDEELGRDALPGASRGIERREPS
jgi:hypothetical protein